MVCGMRGRPLSISQGLWSPTASTAHVTCQETSGQLGGRCKARCLKRVSTPPLRRKATKFLRMGGRHIAAVSQRGRSYKIAQ